MTPNRWEHNRMVELAGMVVEAAGQSVDVATDLHTRLDKHSAIRLARDLEPLKLMWLEEPVPPENIDVMAEITRSTSTPICAGENLYLRHGFRKLLEQRPSISSCPISRNAAGFQNAARSPSWRIFTRSRSRPTTCPPRSAPWRRHTSAPPYPTS